MAKKCEIRGNFKRCRQESPKHFAPRSLRTITRGKVKIIVGCPKGRFKKGRCTTGTRAQSILYPIKK
jgi:hypothetical protein